MNALSVLLLLPIKHGIFILWQHLLLRRHLRLPPLNRLQSLSPLRQRSVQRRYHAIHRPQSQPVSPLLKFGQPPGDLPQKTARERIRSAEWAEHNVVVFCAGLPAIAKKTVGSCSGEFSKLFAVASDWPLRNLGGVHSGRNNDAPEQSHTPLPSTQASYPAANHSVSNSYLQHHDSKSLAQCAAAQQHDELLLCHCRHPG